jgi:outer membrane lipoprotein-sorting protein
MSRRGKKICFLICLPFLTAATDIAPEKVIKNVEEALRKAKTLKIVFEEMYLWELTGEEQSLKGELLLEGEDRFRVTTEDQIIVSDGDTLWTYSKPSHRVLIDRLTNSDNTILPRQILLQYTREYRSRLAGEEEILGKSCHLLDFTAETGDVFFTRVKVWVDKARWLPRKIEQIDLNENRTIYLIHEIQTGVPLEEGMFRFSIPDGAEVINMI